MLGYLLPDGELPAPGYGTVFLGGPAPALAYQVGRNAIRVMFDLPNGAGAPDARTFGDADLGALPPALRRVARGVVARRPGLVAVNYTIVPERVTAGRVVLVGDAAGCCHPLTATGLSVSHARRPAPARRAPRDGWRRARGAGVLRCRARGPATNPARAGGGALRDFLARTPETRLLRDGILRYWASSARGRARSMALLSTQEGHMTVMAREYTRVVAYALSGVLGRRPDAALGSWAARGRAAVVLGYRTLRLVGMALRARPA